MKYSMMSYNMTRQKEHFDLDEMLSLTRELDLAGIDLYGTCGVSPTELRKRLEGLGIPVVGYIVGGDLNFPDAANRKPAVEKIRRGIDEAVVLGAPQIMIPTPGKEQPREESRRNWIAGLQEVAPFAKEARVTLSVENFPGARSPFVLADDVLEAIRAVDGLKLTFDAGNAASGEEPGESFRRCVKHVVHAHFKDWERVEAPREGYRQMLDGAWYRPALIGEGCVDHKSVLAAMKAEGYAGCINIEYEGNRYPPVEGVRRAVRYLREIESELAA